MISVSGDAAEQERLLDDLGSFVGALAAPYGGFPSRPGGYCAWCAARGVVCPVAGVLPR